MSYDGLVITGWSALARTEDQTHKLVRPSSTPMEQQVEPIVDVTVTAPDADWLAEFTRAVVGARRAASGNIVPNVRSIYRWQDNIEDRGEALVVFHTRQSLVPQLIERVNAEHPYDTPQVLALSVVDADPASQARSGGLFVGPGSRRRPMRGRFR
jgi:periplasmic divalent cation tolerance protein